MTNPFSSPRRLAAPAIVLVASAVILFSREDNERAAAVVNPASHSSDAISTPALLTEPARKASRKNRGAEAARRVSMTDGVELELALDEAMVATADGREKIVELKPAATSATLAEALAAIGGSPVAYPLGAARSRENRRIITRDLSVRIDDAGLAALLKTHRLTLKERPDYAPGFVILSAADPLAALAVIQPLRAAQGVEEADLLVGRQRSKRALPNDALISQQWHLSNGTSARTHANPEAAWAYGGTGGVRGVGIRIGVIDDGVQLNHPDFAGNIDTVNDYDWLDSTPNDSSPSPFPDDDDSHGTPCAGVAAARGNNVIGVSGLAPEATIVGLRLVSLAASATAADEAEAMSWKNDIIQIKSNSWGPSDDGSTLISERPSSLVVSAFANATTNGRGGLGTIITWAGGNGGDSIDRDNSNYDGYANSIHTIAVGASSSTGARASYAENGANLVVCAPSSSSGALEITTTDLTGSAGYNFATGTAGNYADDFGGTSSATPVVSGVVALMLEKNPQLGWRDVQEILIRSAFKISPTNSGWANNSAGFHFNHQFGAGLVDASAAVNLAADWVALAPQTSLTLATTGLPVAVPDNSTIGITRTFVVTDDIRVEHATLRLTASHTNHRNLDITLTSPSGMVSQLAVSDLTKSGESLSNWTFSSVRHWGESSVGTWTIRVSDRRSGGTGSLTAAELKLFGTPAIPVDRPPVITAATLSENGSAFSDAELTVSSITASDFEGSPLTYTYQWQSSTDAASFTDEPEISATLTPDPSRAGKLWRCVITASDGNSNSRSFTTASVNLLTRPPASASPGSAFSYASGLVLGGNFADISRQAIINEFSQGPVGGSSEWVEILVLRSGSLRFWDLSSSSSILVFQDSSVWDNVAAGTRIVIYSGISPKDPILPADDSDRSDGVMILNSTNATFFDPDPDYDSWLSLTNSGNYVQLNDDDGTQIHAVSYGSNSEVFPHLAAAGSGLSAHFIGDIESDADIDALWAVVPQTTATPGAGNTPENAAFVTALRNGTLGSPAAFRLGSGSILPAGLSLDPASGILSGTIAASASPGTYPITIERFNTSPASVSQSFTLTLTSGPSFASWMETFAPLGDATPTGDPDADGLPNLVEYALASDPSSTTSSPVISQRETTTITLTYSVSKLHTDVTLTPEWATSLDAAAPWTSAGITVAVLEDLPEKQTRRATLVIDPAAPRRFLRLRASLPQ